MEILLQKKGTVRRSPRRDVLGLDFDSACTRAVRIRKNGEKTRLVAAAELPAMNLDAQSSIDSVTKMSIPGYLHARYVAMALSLPDTITKLLAVPRPADKLLDFAFAPTLGLSSADEFRISIEIQEASDNETSVLAVAMRDSAVRRALALFPVATPAPCSVELSGLAAMNAAALKFFDKAGDANGKNEKTAAMAVHVDASTTFFAIFAQNSLALLRQVSIGADEINRRLAAEIGIEEDAVNSFLAEDIIDVSDPMRTAFEPLIRQLLLGRDYVARHRNCSVANIFLSGSFFNASLWRARLFSLLGMDANDFNPFSGITADTNAIPASIAAAPYGFAAAVGAALATLEEA
jgi:Tfp pilus assembly PilM family ATPase